MTPKTERAPRQRDSVLTTKNQTTDGRSLPLPPVSRKWRDLRELQAGGFLRTWVESREGRRA